jgi:hypothetical protein
MIGIMAVCGLLLMVLQRLQTIHAGHLMVHEDRVGRLFCRYSMARSAASAMSTSISYFSSMRLKMTRADLESSTTNTRLRAMGIV